MENRQQFYFQQIFQEGHRLYTSQRLLSLFSPSFTSLLPPLTSLSMVPGPTHLCCTALQCMCSPVVQLCLFTLPWQVYPCPPFPPPPYLPWSPSSPQGRHLWQNNRWSLRCRTADSDFNFPGCYRGSCLPWNQPGPQWAGGEGGGEGGERKASEEEV